MILVIVAVAVAVEVGKMVDFGADVAAALVTMAVAGVTSGVDVAAAAAAALMEVAGVTSGAAVAAASVVGCTEEEAAVTSGVEVAEVAAAEVGVVLVDRLPQMSTLGKMASLSQTRR